MIINSGGLNCTGAGFIAPLPADRKLVYVEISIANAPDQCNVQIGVGRDPGECGYGDEINHCTLRSIYIYVL